MPVSSGPALRTERLTLRRWRESDRAAFHALNSDPVVMATIGTVMTRAESDAFLNRIEERFGEQGFGLWCVTLHDEPHESLGFVGLTRPWFREGVEVGWRLRSTYWGRGYAPEAAAACVRFAFDELGLDELISFTAVANANSQRVMHKLGMTRDLDGDFEHPSLPVGHPLRPHVLYRLRRGG